MNITVFLVVAAAVCLCIADGAPQGRMTRKQQRPTRGFKNVEMMTARGFGKRARTEHEHWRFEPKVPLMVAYDFGKRSGNDDLSEEEDEIRVTRGTFKPNANVLIARGFGKREEVAQPEDEEVRVIRGSFKPNSNVLIARGYGKRQEGDKVYGMDNFWENLDAIQEKDGQDAEDKNMQSIPVDWFVNEMVNNAEFARSVVRKFIDLNQDGMLSSDELLRNV